MAEDGSDEVQTKFEGKRERERALRKLSNLKFDELRSLLVVPAKRRLDRAGILETAVDNVQAG